MKIDVVKLNKIPLTILFLVALISCIGFALLYSASGGNLFPWAAKQIMFFLIFSPIMLLVGIIDIRVWYKYAYVFYYIALILLIVVYLLGSTAMGATRWLNLGIIKIQPSEPMKMAIIFALARYFQDLGSQQIGFKNIIKPVLITLIPALLIAKQPDLGTAITLVSVAVMLCFVAGINRWIIGVGFIKMAAIIPLAWLFMYDYQKNRVLNFLEPEKDPLGGGYNIIQSKIAIGSGGLFGKGFINGSQSQLQFLPEHQTDFIFTMYSEEWGFLGVTLLILLYSILIFYCYLISFNARSVFARLLSIGVTSLFFVHIFVNIAMTTGLLPAVGVPLPLLSYGGTMMATILIGMGLIMNVHVHNRVNFSNNLKSII